MTVQLLLQCLVCLAWVGMATGTGRIGLIVLSIGFSGCECLGNFFFSISLADVSPFVYLYTMKLYTMQTNSMHIGE